MDVGDIMSTLGVFSTSEGYHDACGGISCVHRGFQYKSKAFINLLPA